MKKILSTLFITALAISFNVDAVTVTLDGSLGSYETVIVDDTTPQLGEAGTDNYIDPIIAYTLLGDSGDPTEIDWMTATLDHMSVTYDPITSIQKIEFNSDAEVDAYWTDLGDGLYTGNLDSLNEPSHYLLKIGQGQVSYDTFLYENLQALALATIDLAWLEGFSGFTDEKNFDIYRVSHISAVPVPAAFWLFGTALIGFISFIRRTKIS